MKMNVLSVKETKNPKFVIVNLADDSLKRVAVVVTDKPIKEGDCVQYWKKSYNGKWYDHIKKI